jgi:hypothetical protein
MCGMGLIKEDMRQKKTNRVLALITIIAVMVLSMPVQSLTFAEEQVVDVLDATTYEVGAVQEGDPVIKFDNPNRARVSFEFEAEDLTLDTITDNHFYVMAPRETVMNVWFTDDKDEGEKFESVKFGFGVPSERYLWFEPGSNGKFLVTFGMSQVIDVLPVKDNDDADDDGEVEGIVAYITSWKDMISHDADLYSVDPVTEPDVDPGNYLESDEETYEIWVEDLSVLPDLEPQAVDGDATIGAPEIIGTIEDDFIIYNITVTAEDMINTKTYSFKFVKRDKPVITLIGDAIVELFADDTYEELGAEVKIHRDIITEENIDIDPYIDGEDDYVLYNYTDLISVYKIDDTYGPLAAVEKRRDIEYKDIIIEFPEEAEIDADGMILYAGTAVNPAQTATLEHTVSTNIEEPYEVKWTLVEPLTGAISIDQFEGIVIAEIEGEQWVKVEIIGDEDVFDTALIKVLPNNLPIITVTPLVYTIYVDDMTSDYINEGVIYSDNEDDVEDLVLVKSVVGDTDPNAINEIRGHLGTYSILYVVTDTDDNPADETRIVKVVARPVEPADDPVDEPNDPPVRWTRTTVSIKLDKDPVELEYGTEANPDLLSYDLTETIKGSSDKRVTWSIGDDTIATVDDEGVVTAVKQGETTVTVKHTASGKTDTSDVIVFLVGDEPTPLGQVEFYEPYVYGYPDQTFRPSNSVTRAEVATMFAKILRLNIDYTGTQQFNDVIPGTWYYNYVQAINRTNIFVGGSNGKFRPNEPITRAEMATVFGKFWEYLGTPVNNNNVSIADVNNSHWASNYIYMMYNAGIVTGFEDGSYRPEDPTLREHVVGMINTLIDRPAFDAPTSKFTDIDKSHWAFGNIEAASQPFNRLQNYPIPE